TMFMNVVESWYFQLNQTIDPGPLRQDQLRNIGVFIRMFCAYPGFIQVWPDMYALYPAEIRELVEGNIGPPKVKNLFAPARGAVCARAGILCALRHRGTAWSVRVPRPRCGP